MNDDDHSNNIYDNAEWHFESVDGARQPLRQAFIHIAQYIQWLIYRRMVDQHALPSELIEAVLDRTISALDLMNVVDGRLDSSIMTSTGKAFTDYYYQNFLEEYASLFPEGPPFAVGDDIESYTRVAAMLDRKFAAWTKAGRPARTQEYALGIETQRDVDSGSRDAAVIASALRAVQDMFARDELLPSLSFESPVAPGALKAGATDLERIVRGASPHAPALLQSRKGHDLDDPLLGRALQRLQVDPENVSMVIAIWAGSAVVVYRVPGVAASPLAYEFAKVIQKPPGSNWKDGVISGKAVQLAGGKGVSVAYWTTNGHVFHATAPDDVALAALTARLP